MNLYLSSSLGALFVFCRTSSPRTNYLSLERTELVSGNTVTTWITSFWRDVSGYSELWSSITYRGSQKYLRLFLTALANEFSCRRWGNFLVPSAMGKIDKWDRLGELTPNTIVMDWPQSTSHENNRTMLLDLQDLWQLAKRMSLSCLLVKGLHLFPSNHTIMIGE